MKNFSLNNKIIKKVLSPYDHYCVGALRKEHYLTALIMGISAIEKKSKSEVLNSILAFDHAEVEETYIGQINMITVSSFVGPNGLIWGYDIAKEGKFKPSQILSKDNLEKLRKMGIKIINGENLRYASKLLFGTNKEKHFPFFPGSLVPCAVKLEFIEGPSLSYSAVGISIPENRNNSACIIVEDVGTLNENSRKGRERIILDIIEGLVQINKTHKIKIKEIICDLIIKKINSKELGCALVVIPYFLLARKALNKNIYELEKWTVLAQKYFLSNKHFYESN